jgi:flavin reductase (DIM6/NTAB) family NADH-FMN oxidoreductase RutF
MRDNIVALDTNLPIWPHVFTIAPLVVIGTKEHGGYDMAPKHMAMPLGRGNFFGFVCTPKHSTWSNVIRTNYFTVSFPRPDQVVLASLSASPRCDEDLLDKPIIEFLPTFKAPHLDALLLENSYLQLECELVKVIEGFDEFGIIAGKITGAYVADDSKVYSELDLDQLILNSPLLAYVAYGRFAQVSKTHAFPFPNGFEKGK